MASEAAARLIEYYPTIQASNPQTYAAGLVQLFSRYPEHLIAEAIDPVNGLPGECDYLPTIAKVKAFLEPRWQNEIRQNEMIARFNRKRIAPPPEDPEEKKRIREGFEKLSFKLKTGSDA
jgi:hypothetical protein